MGNLLFTAAIIPVVIFLKFIYRKDTEKKPAGLLTKCFIGGCLATIPILFVELAFTAIFSSDSLVLNSFYSAFIVAALVEEGFKFLVLYWIIWKHKEFGQYFDGIIYAVFVSLGFAAIENILYVFGSGLMTSFVRAVTAVPAHGLFGVMMGYFFARAKFCPPDKTKKHLWLSLVVPIAFHGFYNVVLFLISGSSEDTALVMLLFVVFIVVMVVMWRKGLKLIKKHQERDIEAREEAKMYYEKQILKRQALERLELEAREREETRICYDEQFQQRLELEARKSHEVESAVEASEE